MESKVVCADCGTSEGPFRKHHIIPQSEGGPDIPENMVLLCRECHMQVHFGGLVYYGNKAAYRALKRRAELTSQMQFVGRKGLKRLFHEEGYLPLFEGMRITAAFANNLRDMGYDVPEEFVGKEYDCDFLKGLRSQCR
jgi:hypothetical protein